MIWHGHHRNRKNWWGKIHRQQGNLISHVSQKNYGVYVDRQQGDLISLLLFLKIRKIG
jgi:hypothetical protein